MVEISMAAPLPDLLIAVKAIELRRVCVSDMKKFQDCLLTH